MRNDLLIIDIILNNNWERPIYFINTRELANLGLDKYVYPEGMLYRLLPFNKDELKDEKITNSEYQYNKIANEFTWGGVENPDVMLDWTNVRMVSSMRIREHFNSVARSLLHDGEKQKAIEVLNKCIKLFPKEKIPYGFDIPDIIETYYMAGETETAIILFDSLRNDVLLELEYYKGFEERLLPGLSSNIRLNIYLLQLLERIKFVKGESGNQVLNDLKTYYNYFYAVLA